ncbi:MAG: hypothetical protein ACM3Q0_02365 [Bacteroidota bacterium]
MSPASMAAGCRPTAVVIGVVIDRHGRPLCSETWPGNATDVQALLPVIDRLRGRLPSAGSASSPIAA